MRRAVRFVPVLMLIVCLASSGATPAQEQRYEIVAGLQYPLLSQRTEIEQDIDFNFRFLVDVSERFSLGLVYEKLQSQDDLKRTVTLPDMSIVPVTGDVDVELYGVQGLVLISGEDRFQIYILAGIGRGSLDFDSSIPPASVLNGTLPPGLADHTDVSLWYEFGAGFRVRAGNRWTFRLQLTGRTIEPERPAKVLRKAETALVPNFSVGLRF